MDEALGRVPSPKRTAASDVASPGHARNAPWPYTGSVAFTEAAPGLFIVTYRAPEELEPEAQAALVSALERASLTAPPTILFDVGPGVARVSMTVPTFWLGVTDRLSFRGLAVVTKSTLVRMAANGFRLATVARGKTMRVAVFETLDEAKAWAAQLASPAAA